MKQIRALCIGDSNTYGYDPRSFWGSRYGKESRWPDLLADLSGWTVLNAGENGREIPAREAGRDRVLNLIAGVSPINILLVMLGSNDLLQGVDPAVASERMELFLRAIPIERGRIVLIAPPPMKEGEWVTEPKLLNESMNLIRVYCELAEKLEVRFVDTREWETELTFDGVHFSEAGHRRFAEELWLRLKEIKGIEQHEL